MIFLRVVLTVVDHRWPFGRRTCAISSLVRDNLATNRNGSNKGPKCSNFSVIGRVRVDFCHPSTSLSKYKLLNLIQKSISSHPLEAVRWNDSNSVDDFSVRSSCPACSSMDAAWCCIPSWNAARRSSAALAAWACSASLLWNACVHLGFLCWQNTIRPESGSPQYRQTTTPPTSFCLSWERFRCFGCGSPSPISGSASISERETEARLLRGLTESLPETLLTSAYFRLLRLVRRLLRLVRRLLRLTSAYFRLLRLTPALPPTLYDPPPAYQKTPFFFAYLRLPVSRRYKIPILL